MQDQLAEDQADGGNCCNKQSVTLIKKKMKIKHYKDEKKTIRMRKNARVVELTFEPNFAVALVLICLSTLI